MYNFFLINVIKIFVLLLHEKCISSCSCLTNSPSTCCEFDWHCIWVQKKFLCWILNFCAMCWHCGVRSRDFTSMMNLKIKGKSMKFCSRLGTGPRLYRSYSTVNLRTPCGIPSTTSRLAQPQNLYTYSISYCGGFVDIKNRVCGNEGYS